MFSSSTKENDFRIHLVVRLSSHLLRTYEKFYVRIFYYFLTKMSKKKKPAKINGAASGKVLEIKAFLEALSILEQDCYPANVLIVIAKEKVMKVFNNIETTRKILKLTD